MRRLRSPRFFPVSGMDGYQILLRELKARIRTARLRAALAVNEELVLLYWGRLRGLPDQTIPSTFS
jgi:hypothetical protein